jgi:hypothetical protein
VSLKAARLQRLHGRRREPEEERGADAHLAAHRDVAAHEPGQAPADREAEPRAAVRARERHVDLHERLEDRLQPVGRDALAGVLHAHVDPRPRARQPRVGRRLRRRARAHDDAPGSTRRSRLARRGELDRVGEQVGEDLPHARLVAPRGQPAGVAAHRVGQVEPVGPRLRRDEGEGAGDGVAHPERLAGDGHVVGLDAREVEHLVISSSRCRALAPGAREVPALPRVSGPSVSRASSSW